jgi:hypothetical protein
MTLLQNIYKNYTKTQDNSETLPQNTISQKFYNETIEFLLPTQEPKIYVRYKQQRQIIIWKKKILMQKQKKEAA